ncbi:hypothetical protein IMZ31_22015 (plasmid) [Pontibacillus sp. ALD_SL1]|uniref:hypothetical protein n=1 Tax=Pontibacillus sp. ALD_SL1 TaxID=2777185 RepID=UPI001A97544E|nr:hypothetical protein [Pontibacillus sp. ALD_SL1]QST02130.1 hypothetical protein IMZ31_22015 [Pontibacillus sp. ALD_SL1]
MTRLYEKIGTKRLAGYITDAVLGVVMASILSAYVGTFVLNLFLMYLLATIITVSLCEWRDDGHYKQFCRFGLGLMVVMTVSVSFFSIEQAAYVPFLCFLLTRLMIVLYEEIKESADSKNVTQ